eukprot:TRINITY_DN10706_c0_g1_i1.p1 TRINITY_DN10706_c0_g1~~TRINITY_DN10706_c0_g1_i1.p1  ORF type:complete len:162 (-),score=34.85 TRINITY_DN10706_c0_g1_i1:86-571(-)
MTDSPLYSFQAKTLDGQEFDFNSLRGKVVLIVNTASHCGFTSQYELLQQLHDQHSSKGLVILGFPCNQFGGQEPGSADTISSFCQRNYGVTFQMMEKIDVNGDNAHPLYEWLKKEKSQLGFGRIKWNFEKFLLSREGKVVERHSTLSKSLEEPIEKLLSEN